MKIIETKLVGKTPNQNECEDGLFLGNDYIAVVDGATSIEPFYWSKEKGGLIAMKTIIHTLETAKVDFTAHEMICYLENQLKKAYGSHYQEAKNNEKLRMFANTIIYSNYQKEIWRFGDCQCIINGTYLKYEKKIDDIIAEKRSEILNEKIENGHSVSALLENDISRVLIQPMLLEALKLANSSDPLGYAVLNGIDADCNRVDVFKVNPGSQIVLASDGYPVLMNTLSESEQALQETIKADPLMYSVHKSVKGVVKGNLSFDDRVYVKFEA